MPAEPMIGLHISAAGSLDLAFDRAQEVGADTFQIFTRNPNRWKFDAIPKETVLAFHEKRKGSGIRRVVDHMPYLPNLASSQKGIMKLSRSTLDAEVKRCDSLGIDYLVLHLGSHLGAGVAVGVRNIAEAVNAALAGSSGETMVLLENTAGAKNSVGSRFEELRMILDKVKKTERAGVVFDTCLPPDSLVLSGGTPKRIQDVLPGERVVDSSGTQSTVTRILRRPYSGDLVYVRPAGLPWIRATPEHPLMYVKVNRIKHLEERPWRVKMTDPPSWVKAIDVKVGNYLVMPRLVGSPASAIDLRPYFGGYGRSPVPLDLTLTLELAELLGLYLAEGFTFLGEGLGIRGGDRGKVYLSFGKHERDLIQRTVHLFDLVFGLKAWVDEAETAAKVCVGSNVLSRFLRTNFGSNARNKRIPSFILFSEESLVRAFLLAYLAGDGCVDGQGIRFVTSSEMVANQLVLLMARLDMRATIYRHKPTEGRIGERQIHGKGWFVVSVGRPDSRKLGFKYHLSTAPQRTVLRTPGSFLVPIGSIQRAHYEGDVFNLTTETGSFLAPLMATHNCHAWAAGFDLGNDGAVRQSMDLFEETVGKDRLKVVHLNDSKGPLGGRLDRHENVGEGRIGKKGIRAFLHYRGITDLPVIMETPFEDEEGMRKSLKVVRSLLP